MSWRGIGIGIVAVAACFGQQYEMGAAAGGGFARNATLAGAAGSAAAGLGTGEVFGGWIAHGMYSRISGEVRYSYMRQDLQLSGGSAKFQGEAHAMHYDVLFHAAKSRAKVQPFVAVGGGFKLYRGTGTEAAYQPLSNFGYLTKTMEWKPMISAGGGVRVALTGHVFLRMEFRDYITPFPSKVITPAPGVKASGWLHDIVPLAGIGVGF